MNMDGSGMDYKAAGFWLDFLQWLSIGVVAVWGYLRTKDRDNALAVKKVANELAEFIRVSGESHHAQSLRLTTVEERLRHIPTAEELARIEGAVSEVKARVEGVEVLVKRIEHQTNLMHQHLLNMNGR